MKKTSHVIQVDEYTSTRLHIIFAIMAVRRLCNRTDMQGTDPLTMLHNWARCYKLKRKEARNGQRH